jgi:glucose-1-phosphate adenylyltransferase
LNEFIDLLPAQQSVGDDNWYRGTADAVFQNLHIIRSKRPQFIVVLAGDHVYKMDYSLLLTDHVERGAPCTVACIEVPIAEASGFGVLAADRSRRITDFVEKSPNPPSMHGKPDRSLASMGVYVFNAQYLYDVLAQDLADPKSNHDFGRDIVPRAVRNGEAVAHPFEQSCVTTDLSHEPYWRDVGTIDAYWEANIDLTAVEPLLDMYDGHWPILTYQEQLPPAKFVFNLEGRRGMALDSLVSGGCIISGATLEKSLLFSKCHVNSYSQLREAVLLPEVTVGRHARLTRVVIDHGCHIPEGMVIGEDAAEDAKRFERTDKGITLVTRDMLARLG